MAVRFKVETLLTSKGLGGTQAGLAAVAGAAAAVGSAFAASTKLAADFEVTMKAVQGIVRATPPELKALEASARDLGATTRFTATQVAEAEEFLARAGFEVGQIIGSLPAVLNIATAAQMDLGTSADIVSNIMQAFALNASEASSAADILVGATTTANTNMAQLAEAMKFVGPIAEGLNVSMADTAAAVGVLSDAGLQASLAGTGLKRALSALETPSNKAVEVLDRLNVSLEDVRPSTNDLTDIMDRLRNAGLTVADALKIAEERGGTALAILARDAENLAKKSAGLSDVEGRAQELADTMNDTLVGAWKNFKSALEDVGITIGQGTDPILKELLESLTKVTRVVGQQLKELGGLQGGWHVLNSIVSSSMASITRTVGTGSAKIIEAYRDIMREIVEMGETALALARPMKFVNKEAAAAFEILNAAINKVRQSADSTSKTAEQLRKDTRDLATSFEEVAQTHMDEAIRLSNEMMDKGKVAASEFDKSLDGVKESADTAAGSIEGLQEAVGRLLQGGLLNILRGGSTVQAIELDLKGEIIEILPVDESLIPEIKLIPFIDTSTAFERFIADLQQSFVDSAGILEDALINIATEFGQQLARGGADLAAILQQALPSIGSQFGQAVGSAFGPLGGAAGGFLGGLLGGLLGNLFKRGADEAVAKLKSVEGQLLGFAEFVEGDLAPALASMTQNVIQSVNAILAEFGGTSISGEFGFKIRQGEVVRIYYLGLTAEFEDQAAAASFLVAKIISESMIEGLGKSVQEALQGSDFESVEELLTAMRFAEGIDNALRTPLEQFMAGMMKDARLLLSTAADLGISLDRATLAVQAHIQAQLDAAAQYVLTAAGLDSAVPGWVALNEQIAKVTPKAVKELEQQLRDAANAALKQAQAAKDTAAAFDGSSDSFHKLINDLELTDEQIKFMTDRFNELMDAGVPAEEIVRELTASLEGLSAEQIKRALEVFRGQFIGGIFSSLADLADKTGQTALADRLRAKAMELQIRMQLLSIRTTIQQAHAEGLLSGERVRQFNNFIRQIQAGFNQVMREGGFGPRPDAGPEPEPEPEAGGSGRRRAETDTAAADAALAFDEAARSLADSLAPASDFVSRFTSEAQRLRDLASEGAVPLERLNMALQDLAALGAQELAAPWEAISRAAGESAAEQAFREVGERAAQALADAAAVGMIDPDLWRETQRAIRQGLRDELSQLGQEILDGLAGPLRRLRNEGEQAIESIEFLVSNMRELGLTAGEIAATIRQNVIPQLLDLAIAEAQRVGDFERAEELQRRQAQLQTQLQLVQLAIWQQMLEAANALDDGLRQIIDDLRADLTSPDFVEAVSTNLAAALDTGIKEGLKNAFDPVTFLGTVGLAPGGVRHGVDGDGSGAAGRTLAEIIEDLLRQGMTPMERLKADWAAVMAEIAEASGTAAEREQALALARARQAEAIQELMEQQLSGVRDLKNEIENDILKSKAPRAAVLEARTRFEQAQANFDPNDKASVDAFVAAGRTYRELLKNYSDNLAQFGGAPTALLSSVDARMAETLGNILAAAGLGPEQGTAALSGATLGDLTAAPAGAQITVQNGPGFAALQHEVAALRFVAERQSQELEAMKGLLAENVEANGTIVSTVQRLLLN